MPEAYSEDKPAATFGARGLFYASESVTRKEWSNYVEGIEPGNHFEGLQALSYAERVEPEEREAFARRARKEGLPELRSDLDPGGERSAYFPITYTGPLDGSNANLLGYDFYAEPTHRLGMDHARDTGVPQATKRVCVLTEAPADSNADLALEQGFVVYLPVYNDSEPQETSLSGDARFKGLSSDPLWSMACSGVSSEAPSTLP